MRGLQVKRLRATSLECQSASPIEHSSSKVLHFEFFLQNTKALSAKLQNSQISGALGSRVLGCCGARVLVC